MRAAVGSGTSSLLASALVVVSSACCVGPLAFVLSFVGLGSSSMLAIENVLGPYRPWILGLTVVSLGFGFTTAYRPQTCASDAVCARPGALRLQRVMLWLATALFGGLLYFTYVHPNLDLWFGIY